MYLYLCVHFGVYKSIKYLIHQHIFMVNHAKVKLYAVKSRHSINLPSDFVRDSAFPFSPNDNLKMKIDGKRIVIEKESED